MSYSKNYMQQIANELRPSITPEVKPQQTPSLVNRKEGNSAEWLFDKLQKSREAHQPEPMETSALGEGLGTLIKSLFKGEDDSTAPEYTRSFTGEPERAKLYEGIDLPESDYKPYSGDLPEGDYRQKFTSEEPERVDLPNQRYFDGIFDKLIFAESSGDPTKVNPETGASGLTQVMEATAADPGYGVKPMDWEKRFDPVENERFGREYLKAMLKEFDGDYVKALAAYNWGVGNVKKKYDGTMASLPKETQNYVRKIMGQGKPTKSDKPRPRPEGLMGKPLKKKASTDHYKRSGMAPILFAGEGQGSVKLKEYAYDNMRDVIEGPLTKAVEYFGKPIVINDAIAKKGTTRVKETPGSQHFHGKALDISTNGYSDKEKIKLVESLKKAGFNGFGFGNGILHADTREDPMAWAYGNTTYGGYSVYELINYYKRKNT